MHSYRCNALHTRPADCAPLLTAWRSRPWQVAINATVTTLLRLMALLSMPLLSAVGFYYLLDIVILDASSNAMYASEART